MRRVTAPIVLGSPFRRWRGVRSELIVAAARWRRVDARRVGGNTTRPVDVVRVGLDVGIIGVGVAAARAGVVPRRSLSVFGGGLGIIVQGLGSLCSISHSRRSRAMSRQENRLPNAMARALC